MLQNYPKIIFCFKNFSAAFDIGIIICSQPNNIKRHFISHQGLSNTGNCFNCESPEKQKNAAIFAGCECRHSHPARYPRKKRSPPITPVNPSKRNNPNRKLRFLFILRHFSLIAAFAVYSKGDIPHECSLSESEIIIKG